jgi:Uma2 family endonuclease
MSAEGQPTLSESEYLAREREGEQKHEYYGGRAVALAGGSAQHNRIPVNVIASLHRQLHGRGCGVYSSDMRVKVEQTGAHFYPDASVVCGGERFADESEDRLLNPTVIIEVLSPSTERQDRGRKFEHYRAIESLREYILIAQDQRRIDHFTRQSDTLWTYASVGDAEGALALPSVGCTLTLAEIYSGVRLTED